MVVSTSTFAESTVKELLAQQKAEFDAKIGALKSEAAKHRTSKDDVLKAFAESVGMEYNPDKKPTAEELIDAQNKRIKNLEDMATQAEQAKTKIERQAEAQKLAEKAGLKAKIVKLIDIDAADLSAELARVAEEFPELKEDKTLGGPSNPHGANTITTNPYKKESLNLTQQYKLETSNPALAAKYKAEAGF